ncbi:MAG TPA: hypothetical protein VER55_06005 [Ardenticatenaceae bacterium]|nr:hypothetical protein [Ardenticatenaceae bacterium]
MILVRNIFQAKFGKAGEVAQGMAQMARGMMPGGGVPPMRWRILTDLSSGPFDTVVMETVHNSLAEFEQWRTAVFASPDFQQDQEGEPPFIGGRAEIFTIEAEGGQ